MSKVSRRKFLSGAAVTGLASFTGIASAMAGYGIKEGENEIKDIEQYISILQNRTFNNVHHIDVAVGPEAVQEAVDKAENQVVSFSGIGIFILANDKEKLGSLVNTRFDNLLGIIGLIVLIGLAFGNFKNLFL